ncbi:MAG: DUF2160 domain-containing protein [Kiloniellales bacterium]|nr:DUF2160 domain-containing protein [Kiloniellales bacterium]MDJ0969277.1 DUF2160 domain-containing protein [Kiloniellales bacterium]
MSLEWMAWTLPTAIFFSTIVVILIGMTVWQLVQPTVERRGVLPIRTTRGDRLFIALLTAAYIHLGFIGLTELSLWIALGVSIVCGLLILRYA